MAPHSGILAWKIPRAGEPGGLQSMGLQRAGHDWATEHKHTLMWKKRYHCRPYKYNRVKDSVMNKHASKLDILNETGKLFERYQLSKLAQELILLFSCSVMSDSLWPHGLQHVHCVCDAIQPSYPVIPFFSALNHRLNGHEFEQPLGNSEGEGSWACCSEFYKTLRNSLKN